MARGPDHLLWALTDDIVDGYFPFADALGDDIDAVQDAVIAQRRPGRRSSGCSSSSASSSRSAAPPRPTREVFNQLTNRENPLIDAEEVIYFRDVYDHLIRLTDEMDNYRELASSTLDIYLTQVNNNLSTIMKRLTGVTVILAGIGAVAGIFGMSEATIEAGNFWLVTGRDRGRRPVRGRSCCAGSTGSEPRDRAGVSRSGRCAAPGWPRRGRRARPTAARR